MKRLLLTLAVMAPNSALAQGWGNVAKKEEEATAKAEAKAKRKKGKHGKSEVKSCPAHSTLGRHLLFQPSCHLCHACARIQSVAPAPVLAH